MNDPIYCELNDSFGSDQEVEKNQFLDTVTNLQIEFGYTSAKLKEFLFNEIKNKPLNYYAYHFLYEVYLIEMDIEKARDIALQLLNLKDCDFFRFYLNKLDNYEKIYHKVYIYGDKIKLPETIIKSLEENESIQNFKKAIER